MKRISLIICFLIASIYNVFAHEPDHSYIFLRINENSIEGRFEIGRLDFNRALGLNLSESLTQQEVDLVANRIDAYMRLHAKFEANGQLYDFETLEITSYNIDDEDDNVRLDFRLMGLEEVPNTLTITYDPFFNKRPNHKGVLIIEYHWEAGIINNHSLVAEVFTSDQPQKEINLSDVSVLKGFIAMVKLGMWHIWIGLDHILFLVALVLPAVVRRQNTNHGQTLLSYGDDIQSNWQPVAYFKPAAWYILKIVTFFTIAHSITLAIASLGILDLPSRIVESIIAFSIALAALHNITPIFKSKEWLIAFAFGLFHGFGFASVLGEKSLGGDYLVLSLFGFNLGVEVGQVAIIAGIFPILFLLRTLKVYPKILVYGSALLILISMHWSIERFFEVNIPIGRWVSSLFGSIIHWPF